VVLAGEFLREAKRFLEDGLPPQTIVKGYRKACQLALGKLREMAYDLGAKTQKEKEEMFIKCAETTLNSKLISGYKTFFAEMVTEAVMSLGAGMPLHMIGIKKVTGGAVTDSMLVKGVAFKKTFSYAGFEQQPKCIKEPKVLLLHLELELKAEKDNAEVRLSSPDQYQAIVDAEWTIIYEKLDLIVKSGANVVLSRLPIGDLATQYFADRGIFCAGRVEGDDLQRTSLALGAAVQTTVNGLTPDVLGTCRLFEERQLGGERYNFFLDPSTDSKSVTIIIRGGAQQFIDEVDRSLHDAIMIVRRANKNQKVVAGGGAIELELSRFLREYSRRIDGKQQLVINYFARALECIPRALAANSGGDATEILNKLRQKHHTGGPDGRSFGVDCINIGIMNSYENYVWEPIMVKENAISSACEAACVILSIDETVKNQQSEKPQGKGKGKGKGKR
jgi:T-complex protein 1 subunit eta